MTILHVLPAGEVGVQALATGQRCGAHRVAVVLDPSHGEHLFVRSLRALARRPGH